MPIATKTPYDNDADQQHDLSHIKSAEKTPEQTGFDREFDDIAANYGNQTDHPLGVKEAAAADDTLNYNSEDSKKNVRVSKGWWNKKRAKVAGGVAGVGVTGGLLGLSFVAGPLEFIHLAEILHDSHISQQENAGDGRMGKMFRFLRSGGRAGETRIGWLASNYHGKMIAQLGDIGIEPHYGTLDTYDGFTVDTEHESSPYKGMTPEEAASAFEEKTGFKPDIDGKTLRVNATKFFAQKQSLKAMLGELGDSKMPTALRWRILAKFGLVTWHPLAIADRALSKGSANFFKDKWNNRIKDGVDPSKGDGSQAKTEEENPDGTPKTDKNGTPVSDPVSPDEASAIATAGENSKSLLQGFQASKGLKITGGLAAAAGLACALKSVDDNIANIRYYQVIVPMIRVGLDAISVGSQIMSGQDVDPNELKYLAHFFATTDAQTGKTQSWTDATTIRNDSGQSGGIDVDSGVKDTLTAGKPAWLGWTQSGIVGGMCSDIGSAITTVVSFAVGVISGNTISTAVGAMVGFIAAPKLIDYVSNLLAGDALDVAHLAGAEYGGIADYGATLGASAGALTMGATALTPAQSSQLNTENQQELQTAFQSQSFFARTLDLDNYRSLASMVLSGESSSFAGNLASATSGVLHTFGSVLHMPFQLYASTVHAAPTPYQYPFPVFGFSQQDLDNPAVADPYANADDVAKLLDSNNQNGTPDYVSKAADCFGVNITKGADGWDVIPTDQRSDGKILNPYDSDNYNTTDCSGLSEVSSVKNTNAAKLASAAPVTTQHGNTVVIKTADATTTYSQDTNWLKVRFFILDTGVMEGYACGQLDDATSCANDGEGTASDTPTPTDTSTDTTLPVSQDPGDATQVVTVKADSTSSTMAKLEEWDKTGNTWQEHGSPVDAYVGSQGLTKTPNENLEATPIGSFTLTQAFGAKPNPGTDLKYTKTTSNDWWDENPSSPTYNQLVARSSSPGGSSEHLLYETPAYDYAVVIDANMNPVKPGGGSGFFLHVSENKPTAGCVSIPETDLTALMKWLKTTNKPRILIDAGQ